uniref:Uncharacterized protein n=1 Tax=Arundo donax TaxID=35708 RepID=A0A0A9BTE7_ARUDO
MALLRFPRRSTLVAAAREWLRRAAPRRCPHHESVAMHRRHGGGVRRARRGDSPRQQPRRCEVASQDARARRRVLEGPAVGSALWPSPRACSGSSAPRGTCTRGAGRASSAQGSTADGGH